MGYRVRKPKQLSAPAGHPNTARTFWDGEPCLCRRVLVRVGTPPQPPPMPWYLGLEGTERRAVEITTLGAAPERFYLDDDAGPLIPLEGGGTLPLWNEGEGWSCVARHRGNPAHGYKCVWPDPEGTVRELRPEEFPGPFQPMSPEQAYHARQSIHAQLEAHNAAVREAQAAAMPSEIVVVPHGALAPVMPIGIGWWDAWWQQPNLARKGFMASFVAFLRRCWRVVHGLLTRRAPP